MSSVQERRSYAVHQQLHFVHLFVEEFKENHQKISNLINDKSKDSKLTNDFIETLSDYIAIPYKAYKVIKSKPKKASARNIIKHIPSLKHVEEELSKFAYQLFCCFEAALTDCTQKFTPKLHKIHSSVVRALVKCIMIYFIYPDLSSDLVFVDHFFKASFNECSLLGKLKPSQGLEILQKAGIVLEVDGQKIYFVQRDVDQIPKFYRRLTDSEMKLHAKSTENDPVKRLSTVLKKEYKKHNGSMTDYEYLLTDSFDKFMIQFDDKFNQNKRSQQMLNLPTYQFNAVHRKELFDTIEDCLLGNDDDRIAVLHGFKGYGKTNLAAKIAHSFSRHRCVFWMDCETKMSINDSIGRIYKLLYSKSIQEEEQIHNYETILNKIYIKYQTLPMLLILDNAQSVQSIEQYLPKQRFHNDWKILVTTSSNKSEWQHNTLQMNFIQITSMNVQEATQLFCYELICLLKRDYNFDFKKDAFDNELKSLFNTLPQHPLVIKQCAVIVYEEFRKYSNDTRQNYVEIIGKKIEDFVTSPNKAETSLEQVYSTTQNIIRKLEEDIPNEKYKKNVHKVALGVLNMMSYFALSYVPKYFFMFYCNEKYKSGDDRQFLLDVTDLLVDNMIVKSINDQMTIEELVQIVNRKYLKEKDVNVVESILREGIRCVVEYLQSNPLSDVIQHLTSLWKYASNYENIVKEFIANQQGYYKLNILVRNEKKANKGNTTMLHIIAQYNELEVIKRIVKIIKETDDSLLMDLLNKRNHLHRTPLECATEGGNLDVVKLFVQLNPNSIVSINETLNERPKQWSPLQIATKNGHKDIVDYLIEKNHGIGGVTKYGYTLAHLAAANGSYDLLKMFVNAENVNQCTDYNFTPLHLACHVDNVQSVKLLIELGANCEAVTKYGKTALHFAADRGFDDIVQVLLSHSDNLVKMKDNKGFTPLHWAAFSNHSSTVDIMLKKDQSIINEQTTEGNTALHLAKEKENFDVAKVLLKYKPDTSIVNNNNESCADLKKMLEGSMTQNFNQLLRKCKETILKNTF